MPWNPLTGNAPLSSIPGMGNVKWPTMQVGPFGRTSPYDPNLYGGPKPPPPIYHTYAPTKDPAGPWTIPKGQSLVWVPHKGYTTRPGTAATAAAPKAPTDPWTKLLTQVMGAIETPAQQEARVTREINAQIAAQQKMIQDDADRQRASALAMYQSQAAAGAAAAAMSKDLFGAVGGEFNAAAGEIKGLAHGLSKNAQGATAADAAGQNAALGALGNAPLAEGGTFGLGGGKQQGVEEYRGGTLPGQMFGTQGEAANFGLAGMLASGDQRIVEEANATLAAARKEIGDNQSKAIQAIAAGRGDLYHQYMNDARDSQIKYISLAQGIQAAQSAGTTKPTTRMVNGVLMQYTGPGTGVNGWTKVAGTTKKPTPTKLQTKEFADGIWSWNPVTGEKVKFLGKPKAGSQKNLTWQQKKMADGKYHTVGLDPNTGKVVTDLGVARLQGPAAKGGTKKTLTPGQLDDMVKGWYEGATSRQNVGTGAQPNWQDVPTGKGQLKYQQAYNNLRAKGYNDVDARAALDVYWKRGERGRPWLAEPARRTLTKASLRATPRFHYYNIASEDIKDAKGKVIFKKGQATRRIPYLTRAQYEALRKAGQVPPGDWADKQGIGHVFVIHAQ